MRKKVLYGQPLEKEIGFSRATRVGNFISISGTAPMTADGAVASPGDVYGQAKRCLEIIKDVIEQAGGKIENVTRTRILLTDISRWEDAAKAHGECFADINPACTFVGVSGFINPEWLIVKISRTVLEILLFVQDTALLEIRKHLLKIILGFKKIGGFIVRKYCALRSLIASVVAKA